MAATSTTQSQLSRWSGVHQPSISQFLASRTEFSDDMLERLVDCMGYHVEVIRSVVQPELTRSERRSWQLHRQLSTHLSPHTLTEWRPHIEERLTLLRSRVTGQPHARNLELWSEIVTRGDVPDLRRILTGLDRVSIDMREVSPMGGLLDPQERLQVLSSR